MSKAATSPSDRDEDPLESVRENEEAFEHVAEREDRHGAIARYFLALARGEEPDDRDAEIAGMPNLGGGDE